MTIKKHNFPLFTLFFALCFFLFACASTPTDPDELDVAIRDTSDYLNDNIPKGISGVLIGRGMSILMTASMIIKMPINNAVAGLQGSFNK